ncbi:MAG: TIGR03936 family radical SAM-associated protein [Clostridiales bacterium]|nr:TIGR03936 family radical SAM-associated protein [Eubacteriales bacterium]MDH7565900.1 TIGR03936 family radical SAM-associated protein [Clostridiales bacterium]
MNSVRIKFIRGEEVKYISHLDLMKVFERALRRGNIPIAYSMGYNPHPQMVFGLPLPVGVTSEAEYADFELSGSMSPEELMESLNRVLPTGLEVVDAKTKKNKSNIMASIVKASYVVLVCPETNPGIAILRDEIEKFFLQPQIIVKKESKGKIREIDIKPMIYELKVEGIDENGIGPEDGGGQDGGNQGGCGNAWIKKYVNELSGQYPMGANCRVGDLFCLSAMLSAGSAANLKPELPVAAINGAGIPKLDVVKIHRTGLLVGTEEKDLDPMDPGAL